jgi:hypothetical protein
VLIGLGSSAGKFQDIKHGIDGACRPFFIHTDKLETKAKEAEERDRQRQGEAPSELKIKKHYTKLFDNSDSPEVLTVSMHSGSMTQEIFYHLATHFLHSRPSDAGLTILLLDGHGSRWSVHPLQKLIAHNV